MTSTGKRVLVVDDDPDFAEALARLVEGMGYTTQIASSPRTALRIVQDQGGVDVLLLDVHLVEQEEWSLADEVRKKASPLETMMVAMSGDVRASVRARAFAAGCDAFLAKPLTVSVLAAILGCAGLGPVRPERAAPSARTPHSQRAAGGVRAPRADEETAPASAEAPFAGDGLEPGPRRRG